MLYNENDAFCVTWLERLITDGHLPLGRVDGRSIKELKGEDCQETTHLFCGIGGWPLACELAGWRGPIWTGSCPCQPYSAAGKGKGEEDERHLWPEMFRLICECRPAIVVGEQVEGAIKHEWLDGVFSDLEHEGYACGAVVLPAACVGAPHQRHRIFWVGIAGTFSGRPCDTQSRNGQISVQPGRPQQESAQSSRASRIGGASDTSSKRIRANGRGADAGETASNQSAGHQRQRLRDDDGDDGTPSGTSNANGQPSDQGSANGRRSDTGSNAEPRPGPSGVGLPSRTPDASNIGCGAGQQGVFQGQPDIEGLRPTGWADYRLHRYLDGKARRIPIEPAFYPLVDGFPGSRVGILRGAGNAIVPEVAAVFLRMVMEIIEAT